MQVNAATMEQSSDMLNSILKWNHSNKVRKLTNKNKVNAMQMCLQSNVRILKLFTKYFCEVCKSSKKFSYISSPKILSFPKMMHLIKKIAGEVLEQEK